MTDAELRKAVTEEATRLQRIRAELDALSADWNTFADDIENGTGKSRALLRQAAKTGCVDSA